MPYPLNPPYPQKIIYKPELYHLYSYPPPSPPPPSPSQPPSGPPLSYLSAPPAVPTAPTHTKPASLSLNSVLGKALRFTGIDYINGFFRAFDLWCYRHSSDDKDKMVVLSTKEVEGEARDFSHNIKDLNILTYDEVKVKFIDNYISYNMEHLNYLL